MRIALTGHKQAGKSECAKFCKSILGNSIIIDMMQPLRTGVMSVIATLGITVPVEHFYNAKTPESRILLQAAGNYARSIDEEILVKYACEHIDCAMPDVNIFVENMRMRYEESAFRERGFEVVRVIRPGYNGDSDVTETEMDSICADYTIVNDGDLGKLKSEVEYVVSAIEIRGK